MCAEMTSDSSNLLEPRDFALWLLASGDVLPRKRARDQQADIAGLQLKRTILNRLIVRDPQPQEFELVLVEIIQEIGPPTGPTRAVATDIRDNWQLACSDPAFVEHLLGEALQQRSDRARGGSRMEDRG